MTLDDSSEKHLMGASKCSVSIPSFFNYYIYVLNNSRGDGNTASVTHTATSRAKHLEKPGSRRGKTQQAEKQADFQPG